MLTKFSDLFMQLHAKNSIPQLEIAVGDQRTALIIRHLTPLDEHDENILVNFAEHNNFFLYLQPKGIESVQLIYPKKKNELLSYQLPDYGLTLQFHPTQFTQINHAINQKMIARAIELLSLDQNDRVLDLFCGIGNFSLPIAKYCHSVVGVEGDSMAIKQAKQNAMNNQINHCQFYCADLFQDPSHEPWFTKTYSKVLLDPPRSGAKSILAHLPKWQPKKVVYVSCNPATFARDAKILTELGYELSKAGIMDMFPHTQHVEVIGLFNYKH